MPTLGDCRKSHCQRPEPGLLEVIVRFLRSRPPAPPPLGRTASRDSAGVPPAQVLAQPQHSLPPGSTGKGRRESIFFVNIDAQDTQDKQDESLLHQKPDRAMIRSGLADARDDKTPDSQNQILYILCIDVHNYSMSALPPGPRVPRLIQMLHWIFRPIPFMRSCAATHGNAFTIRFIATPPMVFISEPAAIRQVFTGDSANLQAGRANRVLKPIVGSNSILMLDGTRHKRERKLLMPPFHGERMRIYSQMMCEDEDRAGSPVVAREPAGGSRRSGSRGATGHNLRSIRRRTRDSLHELTQNQAIGTPVNVETATGGLCRSHWGSRQNRSWS